MFFVKEESVRFQICVASLESEPSVQETAELIVFVDNQIFTRRKTNGA